MKPLKGIEDWKPEEKINTDPWNSFLSLIIFMVIITLIIALTSCGNVQSIPFSVSYEDDNGETFTVTTEIPIHHKIHADK